MADRASKQEPVSAGQLLANARRQEQRSVQDVAHELHLDEWIVEALESDDYGAIGAPVFVKGHMRKYAELMEVAQDDVIAAYYRSEKAPATPPLVAASASRRKLPVVSSGMMLVIVAVIAIALLLVWWFRRDEPTVPELTETVSLSPEPATTIPAAQPDLDTVDSEPEESQNQVIENTADDTQTVATTPTAVVDPPVQVSDGEVVFDMSFSEDSWVEIRDGSGRRLFFGMAQSGSSPSVSGVPPLDVLIGNTSGVTLAVNGERYRIPSSSRRGRTARFQVEQ
ncbi:MAG: RodZ domain-containing protein [Pseudomonadota bacterium]